MPGPEDQMARADGGLRASDGDRDRAVDVLTAAFARGRLAKDEFDLRVGQVIAARTYADLDALTAGLTVGPPPQGQQAAAGVRPRRAPVLVLIARATWARRRLVAPGTGLLLLLGGMLFASTPAFISGLLVLGLSAPQAVPWSPETAVVRSWQRLRRPQAFLA